MDPDPATAMLISNPNPLHSLQGKTVLVTGATGFIGANICPLLSSLGVDTVGACFNEPNDTPESMRLLRALDLTQPESLQAFLLDIKPDTVIHLGASVTASRDPSLIVPMMQANFVSTVNLMEAAAKADVKRIVMAGSMEEPAPGERATSPYAASKAATALYGDLYKDLCDLQIAHVKIAMGYGIRQRDGSKLVPYVINELLAGRAPAVSSGARKADWIYASDIADALAAVAAVKTLPDHPLTVGTGELTSVRDVVNTLVAISGTGISPSFGELPDRSNELSYKADPSLMFQSIGWKPQVGLLEGLQLTWEWFSQRS